MVAKDPKIHWEAVCQAGQEMMPEGLVPSSWVSRSWAWMLSAAEHPSVPCRNVNLSPFQLLFPDPLIL